MTVAYQSHVTRSQVWHGPVDDLETPRGHLFDPFARSRSGHHAVGEDGPGVTDLLANLGGGQSFVAAVVPLHEFVVELVIDQSSQLCGSTGGLQRRAEDERELEVFE